MNRGGREIEPTRRSGIISGGGSVVRVEAVAPVWKQVVSLLQAEPDQRILLKVLAEERAALVVDLVAKGLLGEHPLVTAALSREPFSQAHGTIDGGIFGISGRFDSKTQPRSRVRFAWKDPAGLTVFSEIPLEAVRIAIDESISGPTVVFEFDEDRLIAVGNEVLRGIVTRFVSPNSNKYLDIALTIATFSASTPDGLQEFLQIPEHNR